MKNMKNLLKHLSLLALILALLLAQSAFADAPLQGIFDALVAEDSDYTDTKTQYKEYYPDIDWEESLDGDSIVITISNSEYLNGSWTFSQNGDDLTAAFGSDDFTGPMMATYIVRAVGTALGMDVDVIMGYVNGLSALGIESENFSATVDEATGDTVIRIRDTSPWDMKELDEMVLNEKSLSYGPLDEDYTSYSANVGKLMMIANGTTEAVTILLGEYGGLDDLAYTSLINTVSVLQPQGWESFVSDYTELADADTGDWSVELDADPAEVSVFIDDSKASYRYAIVRFGDPDSYQDWSYTDDTGLDEQFPDLQFVLYLGTNDKDTNEPVFSQQESVAKAREVLNRNFGGYTIQDAWGGWVGDDGTEYEEYTLVIYLSDTTEDQVHTAADELIEVFRQSSILIQANPTRTEFYSGS